MPAPLSAARTRSLAEGAAAIPLASLLLTYGLGKVVHRQFVMTGSETLDARAHELTGFDLVWVMHGFSRPYEMALGLAECIVGLLLLHPRSRLAGALAAAAILANLVLLNVEYQIPALPVAGTMAALAMALLGLRWRQVVGVFWLARPLEPSPDPDWPPLARWAGRGLLVAAAVVPALGEWSYAARYAASFPSPLADRFVIEAVEPADADLGPLSIGAWLYFGFAGRGGVRVGERRAHAEHRQQDGVLEFEVFEFYDAMIDSTAPSLTLRGRIEGPDAGGAWTIDCSQPTGARIRLRAVPLDWPARHRRRPRPQPHAQASPPPGSRGWMRGARRQRFRPPRRPTAAR
jgi:hypothetical protein